MEQRFINFLLRYRYLLAVVSLIVTAVIASGAKNLYFDADYKIFFRSDNPHLIAHQFIEDTYTTSDNLAILLRPADGELFSARNLQIIAEITELGWQAPYVMRVDSLTNFQHTAAEGDDLLVANLLDDRRELDAAEIDRIKNISLTEKAISQRVVSADGSTTLINLTLELPPEADPGADQATRKAQRTTRDASVPEVVKYARQIAADYTKRYPDLEIHMIGGIVINNTFNEESRQDIQSLVPLMYLVILVVLAIFLRSVGSLVGTLLLIGLATMAGVGTAGWMGFGLNSVNVMSPTIILTIAVCDAVHLLMVYLRGLSKAMSPIDAMRESFRLNLQPIVLTSVTTAVGFLTLNFAISPPFAQLGNMAAAGVMWALVLTFTLLPAITMLLVRKRKPQHQHDKLMDRYARFVVQHRQWVFIGSVLAALALTAFVPLNHIDDDPITYFKQGVPFRDASEFAIDNSLGVNDLHFSLDCGEPGCINKVGYLTTLKNFDSWLYQHSKVIHVSTYADVLLRLNKSMNGDDQAHYRLPQSNELSAQYNLLYEMSLPFGLDLNNQINIDKSSTKVSVMAEQMTNLEFIRLESGANRWLKDNFSADSSPGASVNLMFAHVGRQNVISMLTGGVFAILGVTLTILIALRSIRYALISMIPNSMPAFMAFGVWALLVGQVNMAVAAVFSITLGILVDDTVHFISKYRRAREIKGLSPEESIHYAFANVGSALIVTTIVLICGFGMLTLSNFNVNAMSGMLTAITIAIALIFDFLILPPILMFFDREDNDGLRQPNSSKPKTTL